MLNCLELILLFLITCIFILRLYMHQAHTYWSKRNVITLPTNFILGNLENPTSGLRSIGPQMKDIYNRLKQYGATQYGGIYFFSKPVFIPLDVELIKLILSKDFNHFASRGFYVNDQEVISQNLITIDGEIWKNMRQKLTPNFSSGKMRIMFDILVETTNPMIEMIEKIIEKPINIKTVASCFTMDVIGSCIFGIECCSFINSNTNFIKYGERAAYFTKLQTLKLFFFCTYPQLCKKLDMYFFPEEVRNFFTKLVNDIVSYRETNNIQRNDFMNLLISLKKDDSKKINQNITGIVDMNAVIAQSFGFIVAGFESSASTITFCLFELARNQKVQEALRNEINKVFNQNGGVCNYDSLNDMKYLQQVVDETLRLYPVLPIIPRKCTETYKVPNTKLEIEKGTLVMIPSMGIHRDPEFYAEPEKFDPERFNDINKTARHPFTYLPFGEGPRNCIGQRFGIMQAKVALAHLLQRFSFTLNERTKIPLQYGSAMTLTVEGGIWLNVKKIK